MTIQEARKKIVKNCLHLFAAAALAPEVIEIDDNGAHYRRNPNLVGSGDYDRLVIIEPKNVPKIPPYYVDIRPDHDGPVIADNIQALQVPGSYH